MCASELRLYFLIQCLCSVVDAVICSFFFFLGPAVEYDGQTCEGIPTPPPMLGQHTNDVLIDILGYDRKEIHKMEGEGVVKCY